MATSSTGATEEIDVEADSGVPEPAEFEFVYRVASSRGTTPKLHAFQSCPVVREHGMARKPGNAFPPHYEKCTKCWPGLSEERKEPDKDRDFSISEVVMRLQDEQRATNPE